MVAIRPGLRQPLPCPVSTPTARTTAATTRPAHRRRELPVYTGIKTEPDTIKLPVPADDQTIHVPPPVKPPYQPPQAITLPPGAPEGTTDKNVLAGYKAAATRKANIEKKYAAHEHKAARTTPPQPTPEPPRVADQAVEKQPPPPAPDPTGIPTAIGLIALARDAKLERELYRTAQQIRAPWHAKDWSAPVRVELGKALASMIESRNATPKKGQPK